MKPYVYNEMLNRILPSISIYGVRQRGQIIEPGAEAELGRRGSTGPDADRRLSESRGRANDG